VWKGVEGSRVLMAVDNRGKKIKNEKEKVKGKKGK
jgi:hypothetical protein